MNPERAYHVGKVREYLDLLTLEFQRLEEELALRHETALEALAWNYESDGLHARTYNCLKRAGFNYVEQIERAHPSRLMELRNFGTRCFGLIHQLIFEYRKAQGETK